LKPRQFQAPKNFSEISIDLHVTSAGPVALQVSYVISGASWYPCTFFIISSSHISAYDVRVQGNVTKVQLIYYGHIINNTKEDWKDARLSLSTASPDISGAPPTLKTKKIYSQPSTILMS
jgi:hypothetical protein